MTDHERSLYNRQLATLNKLEWQQRVTERLWFKLKPLGESEAIALLKQIEALL